MVQCVMRGDSMKGMVTIRCQGHGVTQTERDGDASENAYSSEIRIVVRDVVRLKDHCTSITSCRSDWAAQT